MNHFEQELMTRLDLLRQQGLYRELRQIDSRDESQVWVGGRRLLNFASNDYLGLATDPTLKKAALKEVEAHGAGSSSSRLICGSLPPHRLLEDCIAEFKSVQAALSFSSGYAAALGSICALMGSDDVIVLDKLVHASIVDAARLSGAKLRVFAHNDLEDLERILRWADQRRANATTGESRKPQVLVVTESVFSMDGDLAPLGEIADVKDRFGAWLMVDEAHATGLYGLHRRGLAEESGTADRIEIQMGTLGKAFGASGGYICGSRTLIDFLINRARSFIFSTAPVPAAAAAAVAGIRFVQTQAGEERRRLLWKRVEQYWSEGGHRIGLGASESPPPPCPARSAIIPIAIGDESLAVRAASKLLERDFLVPAIRYPTVGRGQARLRLTLTAAHSENDVSELLKALQEIFPCK